MTQYVLTINTIVDRPELDSDVYMPAALLPAIRDGSVNTNLSTYLHDAVSAALAANKPLRIRSGTYTLSSTWLLPVGNLDIRLDNGAVIKAMATLPVDAKLVQGGSTAVASYRFSFSGGELDGRLMPERSVGAPDLLYFTGRAYTKILIENVTFRTNDVRGGTAGDSHLFLAECSNAVVKGNSFYGAIDAGIYISGDATEALGENAVVSDNYFQDCGVAFISKRKWRRVTVSNNIIKSCITGIATGEAGTTLLPGLHIIVSSNHLYDVTRGIEARMADGAVISGNRIEDWGKNAVGTPVADRAILLSGSNNCLIQGNVIINSTVTPHASSAAIGVVSRTFNSITYNSTRNVIATNIIKTAALGIFEENASQDRNKYIYNEFEATTTAHTVAGVNSVVVTA